MVICKQEDCKKEFTPKNSKALYCSGKCRQKDYRASVASQLEEYKRLLRDQGPVKEQPRVEQRGIPKSDNQIKEESATPETKEPKWVVKDRPKPPDGLTPLQKRVWLCEYSKKLTPP